MKSQFLIAAALISSLWLAATPVRAQEVTKPNGRWHYKPASPRDDGRLLRGDQSHCGTRNQEIRFCVDHQSAAAERGRREPSRGRSCREGRRYSLLFPPVQQHRARSRCGRQVSGRDHRERQRPGVHSLRGRRTRGHDVVYQAAGGRSLGCRSRRQGSDCAGHDEPDPQAVRHRLRASA